MRVSKRRAHGKKRAETISEYALTTDVVTWRVGAQRIVAATLFDRCRHATVNNVCAELLRLANATDLREFLKAERDSSTLLRSGREAAR